MPGGEIVLFREDKLTEDFIVHFLDAFGLHQPRIKIVERQNQNYGEIQKKLRASLNSQICKNAKFVIVCVDNDRSPGHPGGRNYGDKPLLADSKSHYQTMLDIIRKSDRDVACKTVLAVPVEMIESWVLLILDNELRDEDVPPFGKEKSKSAGIFYSGNPPLQCKDIVKRIVCKSRHMSYPYGKNISQSDYKSLAKRSRSFEMFFGKCRKFLKAAELH